MIRRRMFNTYAVFFRFRAGITYSRLAWPSDARVIGDARIEVPFTDLMANNRSHMHPSPMVLRSCNQAWVANWAGDSCEQDCAHIQHDTSTPSREGYLPSDPKDRE